MAAPENLGGAVPGWRHAVILHDPTRVARRLQAAARAWRWEHVAAKCDRWVAAEVAGYAEEVGKLTNALAGPGRTNLAVQQEVLALRLPRVAAVHHRLLYDSERYLWDRVAQLLGPGWGGRQEIALTKGGTPAGARAALELYVQLARDVDELLSTEQRKVVRWALDRARGAVGKGSSDG